MEDDRRHAVEAPAAHGRPTVMVTIGIVAVLIPLVAGYIILGSVLHIGPLYMGFLFATYWGTIKGLAAPDFVPSLVGALAGIGVAYLLHALPAAFGIPGLLVALSATILPVFFMIRQQAPVIFNPSFLVFLTVATIPTLMLETTHLAMVAGTLLGAAYSGGLVFLLGRVAAMRRPGAAAGDRG